MNAAGHTEDSGERPRNRWRVAIWSSAALLLVFPLLAMQVSNEWDWGPADFVFFGTILLCLCGTYELAARKTGDTAYRAGVGIALLATFLLIWINLAVGIIGETDNPANLMYVGVLAIGAVGAVIGRFEPRGMTRALFAAALAQTAVAVVALIAGLGPPKGAPILALNGFFVALFLGSALLFRKAARGRAERSAA